MAEDQEDGNSHDVEKWTRVLKACYSRRLQPPRVEDALRELFKSSPITGREIARILLVHGDSSDGDCDPLLSGFLTNSLQNSLFTPADLLDAVFDLSPSYRNSDASDLISVSQSARDTALAILPTLYNSNERPHNSREATATFRSILAWFQACNASQTMLEITMDAFPTLDKLSMVSTYESVGMILIVFLNNVTARKHLSSSIPDQAKQKIINIVQQFASLLAPMGRTQIPQQLQFAVKFPPFLKRDSNGLPNLTAAEVHAQVLDLPHTLSKSGMYIYLNAALCGRPRVNDVHLLTILQARYPAIEQSIGGLIVATFDALANALQRQEGAHLILCHRSFITNKVPLLISSILKRQMYPSRMAEQGIQLVLSTIGTHPLFPGLSSTNSEITESIRETRDDFARACQLHDLVSEFTLSNLNGQPIPKSAQKEPLQKHTLVKQLQGSAQKAEELIGELARMDGNAGAISTALNESLRQAAASKDTLTIKSLCTALCRKLPLVDIMLQHVQLQDLLKPLGTFLNEWTLDEDQSELQPAYEEFAIILLFTLAVIHRYDVQVTEMDSFDSESFVIKIQTDKFSSRLVGGLSQEDKNILAKWTKGLFAVDDKGESTGIRDDIMSGCTPQTFFLLVSTLFEQIVIASNRKALTGNTLRGGLEFLLEPFLLPSLVAGMGWLANHAWSTPKDSEIILQMLTKLAKPSSISGEAAMMHQTILGIMYKELRQCLQEIDKRLPGRKDLNALQASLKQYADSQYEYDATTSEIKEWTSGQSTLEQAVAQTFNQLTSWSTQSDINPMPPNYTHRMVDAAVSQRGASVVLDALVEQIESQTVLGFGSPALEVGTALICAPQLRREDDIIQDPMSDGSGTDTLRLTLAAVLRLRLSDATYLLQSEPDKTESLVRLGRLVDSFATAPRVTLIDQLDIPADVMLDANRAIDEALSAIGPADTANIGVQLGDQTMDLNGTDIADGTGLDMDLGDDMFSGGLNIDAAMAEGGQQNAEDDIFAGIDLGMDDFTF